MKEYTTLDELKRDEKTLRDGERVYIGEFGIELTYRICQEISTKSYLDGKDGHLIKLGTLENDAE